MSAETLSLANIRVDGGTQSRANIHEQVVSDYADAIRDGAEFPAIVVFYDGSTYWLADGFHRHAAHRMAGVKEIAVDIRQGEKRDAVLFSVGANSSHGLRRTNEDKRRAVNVLLADAEWSGWSNAEIARACGVSDRMVAGLRPDPSPKVSGMDQTRTVKRNGTTYEQKVPQKSISDRAKARPPVEPGYEQERQYNPPTGAKVQLYVEKPIKQSTATPNQLQETFSLEALAIAIGDVAGDQKPYIEHLCRARGDVDLANALASHGSTLKRSGFEEFWDLYPHKVGKEIAIKTYAAVLKRAGVSAERIQNGLVRYIQSKPESQSWAHPSTFLNQGRYDDAPAQEAPQRNDRSGLSSTARLVLEMAEGRS